MTPGQAASTAHAYFPGFLAQREQARRIDVWTRGAQVGSEELYMPAGLEQTSKEFQSLADISVNPLARLVVNSLVQTCIVEGITRPGASGNNLDSYRIWQENRFDKKQGPLHFATAAHGQAYVIALPARRRFDGTKSTLWSPRSALRLAAFYDEDDDEWPILAIGGDYRDARSSEDGFEGFTVEMIDGDAVYYLTCKGEGSQLKDWTYIEAREHGAPVPPVVRYENSSDLNGRSVPEVEPFLPLLKRIDQDYFDRLVVQRYGAWKVRYITGMVRPANMTDEAYRAEMRKFKVGDFLVAEGKDARFGTLNETQLDGFIRAAQDDLRLAAAVSQTPPYQIMGLSDNVGAEALAASDAGFHRKGAMFRTSVGESHEQLSRLTAWYADNVEESNAYDLQVRWKDTEARPFVQTAQALGILASQVGVPQEMLFERITGWSDIDVQRATDLVKSGAIDNLIAQLEAQAGVSPVGQPG